MYYYCVMCMAFLFFLLMDVVFIEFNFMKYLLLRNIVFTLDPARTGALPPPISSLLRHSIAAWGHPPTTPMLGVPFILLDC